MWLFSIASLLGLIKVLVHLEVLSLSIIANMSWWWVIGLYALTAVWWAYADHSGLTSRKAMEQLERKKKERLNKQRELLGVRRKR